MSETMINVVSIDSVYVRLTDRLLLQAGRRVAYVLTTTASIYK